MLRRSLLRASLGTVVVGLSAGCNGLFRGGARTPGPATPAESTGKRTSNEGTGPARTTAGEGTTRPYRAVDASALDRPRGIRLRNFGTAERFFTLVLRDGDEDVFVSSRDLAAGESIRFADLLATDGDYEVIVETADGVRRQFDWTVREPFEDLLIEFRPEVVVRRVALCTPECPSVSVGGELLPSLDVPDDLPVADALGRTPAVALDNGSGGSRRATVRLSDRGSLHFEYEYEVPPGVRALVPVNPARPRYRLTVGTDDGETTHDWVPGARSTLYATLDGDPRIRCGFTPHELRVGNETDAARRVTVKALADSELLFNETFRLAAGASTAVPAAVEPAGPLQFRVRTDDGRNRTVDWTHCAPNGPLIVSVHEQGILVSVQPMPESFRE